MLQENVALFACLCACAAVFLPLAVARSYSNGLIFYELATNTAYLPPTVSVSRGRNLASVKYSEKGSIWSTFGQPCVCRGVACGCCAGLKVDQYKFDQKVCANITFVPQLEEAQLEVFLNERPSSKYGISLRNPTPFCIPVMMGVPMAMCVQLTDIAMVNNNLNMCMDFVVRLATTDLFEMHFQCMRMGLNGLQYVDKNGKPVLPPPATDLLADEEEDQEHEQDLEEEQDQEQKQQADEKEQIEEEKDSIDYDYAELQEEQQQEEMEADQEELLKKEQQEKEKKEQEELEKQEKEKQEKEKQEKEQLEKEQLAEELQKEKLQLMQLAEEMESETQQKLEAEAESDLESESELEPEPLPIESEMLMAGDQEAATADDEELKEEEEEEQEEAETVEENHNVQGQEQEEQQLADNIAGESELQLNEVGSNTTAATTE
ncbi:uncharacterized protein DDB_G0290301, partial [Drosophila innubila]|uniref:uncharacterized protein DDB_G0290301 n=1 Tax=Drosophila innubila TaxID=198719 RepID=UPI00148B933C